MAGMNVNHERLVNNKIGKHFVQFLSTLFFLVCLFVFYLFLFYFILLEISLVRSAH